SAHPQHAITPFTACGDSERQNSECGRPGRTKYNPFVVMTMASKYASDNRRSKQNAGPTKFNQLRRRARRGFYRHSKVSGRHRSRNACNAQQTCQPNCQDAAAHRQPLFCSIASYPSPTAPRKSVQAGFPCKNLNLDKSGISATVIVQESINDFCRL